MKRVFAASIAVALSRSLIAQAPPLGSKAGEIAELTIASRTYPNGRHAWIYTPPGYPSSCQSDCNLMIAFDGALYLGAMPLPRILDSLIAAKRTGATVAVLFDNGSPPGRLADLANSRRFATFVAEELLPWIRDRYRVTHAPQRTILAGASAGGLGAAYIAMQYPALFGNVLSQSGAFWRGNETSNEPPYEWLTHQLAALPKLDVTFFIDVGARETVGALGGRAPSLLEANRRLYSVLEAKGYAVEYFEVPNGQHSPDTWRDRLPVGIVALAPMPSGSR